jgi:hypothetical protein
MQSAVSFDVIKQTQLLLRCHGVRSRDGVPTFQRILPPPLSKIERRFKFISRVPKFQDFRVLPTFHLYQKCIAVSDYRADSVIYPADRAARFSKSSVYFYQTT